MLWDTFILLMGMFLLYLGAESLVKGGRQLGKSLGISSLVIGLTIIAISTSMPEAVVSLLAQIKEKNGDIALGNVVGSNIANIGLVLGIVALICPQCSKTVCRYEIPMMVMSCIALFIMMWVGVITRLFGLFFICAVVFFVFYEVRTIGNTQNSNYKNTQKNIWGSLFWIVVGGLGLVVGGNFLVKGAVSWAHFLEVSDRVIGVTIIALGTSLPELAASVVSVVRGDSKMALGNIVGSVIFNVLFVVGGVSLISPIVFSRMLFAYDAMIMLVFIIAAAIMCYTCKKITRFEGAILLLGYCAYIFSLI